MSVDGARHRLKARITDYGADCAGHKVAGKGSLADALTAADAYAEAHVCKLRKALGKLLPYAEEWAGYAHDDPHGDDAYLGKMRGTLAEVRILLGAI